MKKYFLFILIIIGLVLNLWAQEKEETDLEGILGLKIAYDRINLETKDGSKQNTIVLSSIVFEFKYELLEDFFIKGIAGYSFRSFSDPVDLSTLPFTLNWEDKNFNSMLFGIGIWSEPLFLGDFSLGIEGEFLFYKLFQQEADFSDPMVTGSAFMENSLLQVILNLYIRYDGFEDIIIFAGTQINLMSGTVMAKETVLDKIAQQEVNYNQINHLGLVCGVYLETFERFDLEFKLILFSRFSLSAGILYEF